jgi:hypothetical protein
MKVENFQALQKDTIISLLKPNKDEQEEKNRLWDWQYIENPAAENFNSGTVMKDDGIIIGYIGYMPVELRYNGKDEKATWGCDLILSPDYRGKGYAGNLIDIYRCRAPIVLGLGSSDINNYMMCKRGYKVNSDIEEYFFTKRSKHFKDFLKKTIQYLNIIKSINKKNKSANLKVTIMDVSDIADKIGNLWEKVENGYTKIVKRNYLYINWKYISHPLKKYKSIVIHSDNETVGIGIFRIDENISRLIDYIGPSKGIQIKQMIIKAFLNQCTRSHLLECTCTDKEFKQSLEYYGFRRYKHKPRFHVYSNIENDQSPEKDWFVMGGDSDNDL